MHQNKRKRSKKKNDSFENEPGTKSTPAEIWSTVFTFVPKRDVIHAVRLVCQHWNEIILTTPSIWNSISYREVNYAVISNVTKFVSWASHPFSRFQQLQEINLSCHYGYHFVFTEEKLRELRTLCPSLSILRIICDHMEDRMLDFITQQFHSLRLLQLAVPFQRKVTNMVTENAVEYFNRLSSMESLHLENIRFTLEASIELAKNVAPRLRHLTLPYNSPSSVLDLISQTCSNLQTLKCLRVNNPELEATSEQFRLEWLANLFQNCKELKFLELGHFLVVNSEILEELIRSSLHRLESFDLVLENSTPLEKVSTLFNPQTPFTNLSILKIHSDDCATLPSDWNLLFRNIADSCPNLSSLSLLLAVDTEDVAKGLETIFDKCNKLSMFSLQCPRANPLLLALANKNLPLIKFSLWTDWSATDDAICAFVPSCKQISILEFTCWSASNITDTSLLAIAASCPEVCCLCLERSKISNQGLNQLPANGLKKLRYLDIVDCKMVSDEAVESLMERYGNKCLVDSRIN